ncbi:MAG: VIT1/CCC1 transporter family protein [Anaerolineaceae bacterium]|nr:VIT1/CCC1 transporter family protein [Anaerolineaceae bacterium]
MPIKNLSQDVLDKLFFLQKDEITSYHTYHRLAKSIKDDDNSRVLNRIAEEERRHYEVWKSYTGREAKPNKLKITFFFWLSRIFGLTFGIKLMEKGEEKAQEVYAALPQDIPEIKQIMAEEEMHENELLDRLDEESLKYAGSMVLGLNDALVELTGALAGFTLAFQNTRIIALAGLITGISASFSMAASEYLSTKSEDGDQHPLKAAVYTGIAYLLTVILLILPFFLFNSYLVSMGMTIVNAILIIAIFNYYISVAKDLSFKKRFFEMAAISLGVAVFSFILGDVIRRVLKINI